MKKRNNETDGSLGEGVFLKEIMEEAMRKEKQEKRVLKQGFC